MQMMVSPNSCPIQSDGPILPVQMDRLYEGGPSGTTMSSALVATGSQAIPQAMASSFALPSGGVRRRLTSIVDVSTLFSWVWITVSLTVYPHRILPLICDDVLPALSQTSTLLRDQYVCLCSEDSGLIKWGSSTVATYFHSGHRAKFTNFMEKCSTMDQCYRTSSRRSTKVLPT